MDIKRKLTAYAVVMTLGLGFFSGASVPSDNNNQQEPTAGEMFADAVAVRPMTLAASAVGLAAWVVTLPFTIPSGSAADAGKSWVVDPLEYTFVRPLGDISDNR